jgi:hypothetical protein
MNENTEPIFKAGDKITNGKYTVDIISVNIKKQRYLIFKFPIEIIRFNQQNDWNIIKGV